MDYWNMFEAFMGEDLEKYLRSANVELTVQDAPNTYLTNAFDWLGSPEGHGFWLDKNIKWNRVYCNPTKLHKLLAGVDHGI
jgi:hypothetical protein